MILKELSKNVYYMQNDSHSDRPTLGYVKGDKFSIMIDTGNSPAHLELFYEGLKERGLEKPEIAVITHWHWDHTYAICAFDGQVIANKLTNKKLENMKAWEWTEEAMKERLESGEEIEFCDEHIRIEYPDRSKIKVETADIIYDKKLSLDLGNINCDMELVGGPHEEDSSIVYIKEDKVLFVGDADCIDFYGKKEKYDKDKLEAYINKVKEIDFETYVHGHCAPMGREETINWLEDFLNE